MEIETPRCTSHYASKTLKVYLESVGLKQHLLYPLSAYEYVTHKADNLEYDLPQLELYYFDNVNLETSSPQELFNSGNEEGDTIKGEALINRPGNYRSTGEPVFAWTNVVVHGCNEQTMMWSVSPLYNPDEVHEIPRLRLLLLEEDVEVFARRVWDAVNLRREVENNMKYHLYLDFVILNGLYSVPSYQYRSIISKVQHMKLPRELPYESLALLRKEVKYLFKKVEADLNFRYNIKRYPEKFTFIRVPESEWIKPVPQNNLLPTLFEDFKDVKEKLGIHYLWSEPNASKAILRVNAECLKVEAMCFFAISRKHVKLEEFSSEQQGAIDITLKYLHLRWLPLICNAIRWLFQDIKKGWYNIHEHNWQMYDFSKLCRFMQLVRFRMQYSIRHLLRYSIEQFIHLLVTPCRLTFDCTEDYQWNSEDLVNSPFTTATSLFLLSLTMDENGPKYTTAPEQFGTTILKFLRDVLYKCHFINQVHPIIMTNLRFDKELYLTSIGLIEDCAAQYRDCLEHAYEKAIIPLKSYCDCFKVYFEFSQLDIFTYVEEFHAENHPVIEIREEIQKHYDAKDRLIVDLPHTIVIGPFIVNVDTFKNEMIKKREDAMRALLNMFMADEKMFVEDVIVEFKGLARKLGEPPNSIEHIFEIREWMETIPYTVMVQEDVMKRVRSDYYIVLDHFYVALENEDFALLWEAVGWPNKLANIIEETEEYLLEETDKFLKLHQMDEQVLMDKVDMFTSQVKDLTIQKDITKVHEIANDIKKAWKSIKETQEFGSLLNRRQKLFGIPVTPFDDLNNLIKEFEPYRNLWVTASDFYNFYDIWMNNPLHQVDVEPIEATVNDYIKTLSKCVKSFSDLPVVQSVAIKIKQDVEDFKRYVPVLLAVKNPGMKEKHWNEVIEITGLPLTMNAKQTFKMCLDQGVAEYGDLIAHIGEAASKEFAIEQALDKMMGEWQDKNLELMPYKNTGTFIMKVADETMQMLNDHLMLTQQLNFSPFKAAFEGKINSWNDKLLLTLAVLETWIECQKQWMYLEPIFTSEDIVKELPVESKKYRTMEGTWRRIMASTNELPKIMIVCPSQNLLESLEEATLSLNAAAKGLSEYMELKRSRFPRLYFLSDDELLGILARAREPLAVQPHLRKCFENIAMLTFEEDKRITEIHSMEGEVVPLKYLFYPSGNVEDWLSLLEDTMKNTVRLILLDCIADLYKQSRAAWVLCWPGQAVIACSQSWWTCSVEEAITQRKVPEFYKLVLENLDSLRNLAKGELTFLQREILFPLIVIEVHARDITKSLVDSNIRSSFDFEWICQLRYYVEDYTPPVFEGTPGTELEEGEVSPLDTSRYYQQFELKAMYVKALNTRFPYYNEYLGNSGRLVITPLTDRCYLTLMGAMHLKFGGAPAGPAGTGKTETTKDLAKALAVQCVVFNCSDQLDYLAMGKFFKGLASSGAWACFDEFNRIDIEVLSVIAQQVVSIQRAQMQHLSRFIFEGTEIGLKPSCAVFITMNPGYAGRSELPDNLKALFRPVAMMVPNFALIVEISLFSYGFGDAKMLAIKVVYTFKLCMEQLSPQDHYDFAMRAVKTVITVAGNLLRQLEGTLDEKQIVLKALKDVNVPKFLSNDLILFNGIISDLFPLVENPEVEYGILEKAIKVWTVKKGCEAVETFVFKTIQYYETIFVRHGVMLVGPAGAGKTKCYQILQAAITSLKGQLSPDGVPFTQVHTFTLNPKSITMGQLYGGFDDQTHEWTDGILSSLVRLGIEAEDKDKRWYIFDGPVDAIWIENMNTVLDDNKKLCLSSGEIMKMTDHQRMVFEVEDLAVASPATVSRCGMVYLDTTTVGIRPIVNMWLKTSIPPLAVQLADQFRSLFEVYLFPSLQFLRSDLKELLTSTDPSLVIKFLELLSWRLRPLLSKDGRPPPNASHQKNMVNLAPSWVVWCLVWSVGATCDNDSRAKFSAYLKRLMAANKEKNPFPADGLVYDYKMHDGGFTDITDDGEPAMPYWKNWMDGVEKVNVTLSMNFTDIEVPTIDMVRSMYLLNCKLICSESVLCIGPPGSGKTLTANSRLQKSPLASLVCNFIMFSAGTSANETQDLIESKLEKRGRGVLGPPLMKKQVFFIDDMNMPAREVYGAQPPLELLRQWMDFEGWYDRRNIGDFIRIIEMSIVGAMAPPGGGRQPVSMRLLRHFHYLAFTDMTDDSKREIFGTIFKPWMERTEGLSGMLRGIIEASLQVFSSIVSDLLPTPTKCHYMFNLRDLAKVFQGMFMLEPHTMKHPHEMVKLWYHENVRVYQDRLVNEADRNWFTNLLNEKVQNVFDMNPAEAIGSGVICFADFMDISSDERKYVRVSDMKLMESVLMNYLAEYNSTSTAPMNLVLFDDAISHVCRISRIIRQPMGNSLLLGMGGSGRQSLSRLACHMAEMILFQVEISKTYGMNDWRDDIKKAMLKAGQENRSVMFLFSDFQIKMEAFLEDINNILSAGDVPNIYASEDLEKIYSGLRHPVMEAGLPITKANLFSFFQKRVRCNLHMVICMSPIGEIFRSRMRQFPSLINCCTVDWFSEWPESALQGVARSVLLEVPSLTLTNDQMEGVVKMCQFAHQSVMRISELFLKQLGRNNYVTPASYLELLKSFGELYEKKKGDIGGQHLALKTGLDKLYETELDVRQLQIDLANLKPVMEKAAVEMRKVIDRIEIDTAIAEEARVEVEKEQSAAEVIKVATEALAADAEKDLAEALPALQAAEDSLKALNKNDIVEVKAMKSPPQGVVKVIESICIIYKIAPIKVQGPNLGQKVLDYWKPGTAALLSDAGAFLDSLMNFDKDSITEAMIKGLKKYITDPAFEPEKIKKVSKACMSLCQWVHAIYIYYHVNLNVLPKKAALAKAKEELAKTEAIVNAAKAKMQKVMDGLEVLNGFLRQKEAESAKTEAEIQLCLARMDRAVRLISGLGSEKVRWIESIANLAKDLVNITGDVLLCSCAVAYMTPFTDKFRVLLFNTWNDKILEYKVPCTQGCSVISVLGDPVMIREWQIYGLPLDTMSTESAVLVANSKRWPLFIDPQGQANHWIKSMCKQEGLIICQPNDKNIIQQFEAAIRFGKPILLENVLETLDNSLDTIIKKQLFTQAGQIVIKVGDSVIPYSDTFKLYITTRMANPLYSPEVSVKLQIVNFALVESGLQEQLLSIAVATERAELEQQRVALVINRAQMAAQLSSMQSRILTKLVQSVGSPVDDIELIETLEAIKIKSKEISIKVQEAEVTQANLDSARKVYIPVAERGRVLFFCLADLSAVDPMYQYSLGWFIRIYVRSMTNTEPDENIDIRLSIIIEYLTLSCYVESCRGLFQRHRVHFAFLLSIRILMQEGKINPQEYHFFLNGAQSETVMRNPDPDWITDKMWQEILSMDVLDNYKQLVKDFPKNLKDFRNIYDSNNPHKVPLPAPFSTEFTSFQKLLVLKVLRLDRLTNGVQDFVAETLGGQFIEPLSMDLFAVYAESAPNTPLIFVLSTGTDPAEDLYKLAEKMKMTKRLQSVSLGQGQGARAEAMFRTASVDGNWIFFQNCHLSPSWMPNLELLVESIPPETVHKDFRIWLTSMPSPAFPVVLLQNGIKMTIEPPRGVKANILKAYTNQVSDVAGLFTEDNDKVYTFKWLLFSLCIFHSVVLERNKFGRLGFNVPYEFSDGDLKICIQQLRMFVMEYAELPIKMLNYVSGQINYGGRVTEEWDRRCLMAILSDHYDHKVLNQNHAFDDNGIYHQLPHNATLNDYLNYVQTLPLNDDPGIFGLHANANISYAQSESMACVTTLQISQGSAAESGGGEEDSTERVAQDILKMLPQPFNLKEVMEKFQVSYNESLNSVLIQETTQYNKLLNIIANSLRDLLKALKGLLVMSEILENIVNSLAINTVPNYWGSKAYPSLKPLGSWVRDLVARLEFVRTWIVGGIPNVFWISGFYTPQRLLTAVLQNYARKNVISIDTIEFEFNIVKEAPKGKVVDGCYIRGLFLEGARWNNVNGCLDESRPKELFTDLPIVQLKPVLRGADTSLLYDCPAYRTKQRKQFILIIKMDPGTRPSQHWIKRGTALLAELDY